MLTLLKINLLTDDEAIPTEIRDQVVELLRGLIRDDPEGPEHARVSLEWKHTVHNRDYMETLPSTPRAERITLPAASERKAPVTKKRATTKRAGARA